MNHSTVSKIYQAFDKMTSEQFIQFMKMHSTVSKIYQAFDKMTSEQFIQFMKMNKDNLLTLEEYHIQLVKTETQINNLTKN